MAAGKEMEIAIRIAGKVESSLKNAFGTAMKGLGSIAKTAAKASLAAGTAFGGLAAAGVKVGSEFESAMSQVSATMLLDKETDAGKAAFETLENAARECGATTAFSAKEAAEGLNYLALAGYDAEKAAGALPTILNLAGAGAMELADASDMVTDAMGALNIEATQDNLTDFADKLAMTASKSNTSVAQLGEAILTVGKTGSTLKGKTTELATMAGILADVGIKASEGGTHIRNMIMSLQMPRNDAAAGLLKSMDNLSAYDDKGNMRGMDEIFGDINKQLKGASVEEIDKTLATIFKQTDVAAARAMLTATADSLETLGNVIDSSLAESGTSLNDLGINLKDMAKGFDTAMTQEQFAAQAMKEFGITGEQAGLIYSGLQSIVGGTGYRFQELSGYIEDSAGACEDMYKIQLDNLEGDMKVLGSAASDLGISFYKDVSGPIRDVTQAASGMVTQLNNAYKSGGLSAMAAEVGNCASQIVNGIAQYAPTVVDVGIDLIQNLVNGIVQNSDGIASAAGEVLTSFTGGIFQLAPQIALAGIDIITQLANSLAAQAPQLLSSGTQANANFVSGLMQRGPDLASAALGLMQSLVSGIAANAPMLTSSAVQLIGSFVMGIAQMLPQLAQMGVQLILSLAQGAIANLPQIIQIGAQMIVSLIMGFSQMLPMVINGGIQLVINFIQGIIGNLGNLAQAGMQIIGALITGLIQSIPEIVMATPRLIWAIMDSLVNTDWPAVGMEIIQGIINGILSTGKGLWNAIKGLVTGGGDDSAAATESAASTVSSYASGIQANAEAVTGAASMLSSTAFSGMDFTAATNAGQQSAAEFQKGMTNGMAGLAVDTLGFGLDSAALAANFGQAGTDSAAELGTTLVPGMMEAGTQGADALGTGITENSQTVVAAADTVGQQVGTSFDASWRKVTSNAQSAMQGLASAVRSGAQQAAFAVKSAFEGMTITIPKPRIPNISVTANSVPYGDGGNVKVPQFSVNWNAAGGIFDRPTIFNTRSGMQGVGEAGAEAVLPLDALWTKMRSIVSGEVRANSGESVVGVLLDRLSGIGAAGGMGAQQPAYAGGAPIQYSPVYNLYGSAGKDEIAEADRMSQAEFNRMMKRYEKDIGRKRL